VCPIENHESSGFFYGAETKTCSRFLVFIPSEAGSVVRALATLPHSSQSNVILKKRGGEEEITLGNDLWDLEMGNAKALLSLTSCFMILLERSALNVKPFRG